MASSVIQQAHLGNIASVRRMAATVTTGSTGNIALGFSNDGYNQIVCPIVSGRDAFLRTWVSSANGGFYLTAVNPNTGATINNTELNIRYLLVRLNAL